MDSKNDVKYHKTALVTGAARRLGAAMAVHLAERGYDIILHCHNSSEEAETVRDKIRSLGVSCHILTFDLSDKNDVMRFIDNVQSICPHTDILINSAAVFDRLSISDTDDDALDRILSVNITSPFRIIRGLAPYMSGGLIINITDAKVVHPDHQYAAYCLSKNALQYLTVLASQEFAPNVRVNAVAPVYIMPSDNLSDYESFREKIPLRDDTDIRYLLEAIDHLISNKLITGQTVMLDGGYCTRRMI